MISDKKDRLISQLTVRLKNSETKTVIGTGVLYYEKKLKGNAYIFTAAHCLFKDKDSFKHRLDSVTVDLYNHTTDTYAPIILDNIDDELILKNNDKDIAIMVVQKKKIEKITGTIPTVEISIERQNYRNFIVKGFPKATQGKELDVIFPVWKQKMTGVNKFQLELTENYSDFYTQGFSGSGVFLHTNETVYLYGIFTRFRSCLLYTSDAADE